MLRTLLVLVALAAAALSLLGWGRLVERASRAPRRTWAVTIALGLAAVVFVGGLLNLLRLAFPAALDGMLVAGWLLLAFDLRASTVPFRLPTGSARAPAAAGFLATGALAAFIAATLVPARSFNFHDDFVSYFAAPVRMIETGTLFAHPLSGLGRAWLGGQALLDGFVVAHLPVDYLNAVDLLFAAVLCAAMLVSHATARGLGIGAALVPVAAVALLNPQYVNVSSLYTGSVFVIALALLSTAPPDPSASTFRGSLPVGLVCAALVALKLTYVGFVLAYLGLATLAAGLATRSIRRAVAWAVAAAGSTLLFLSPWLALYAPLYFRAGAAPPPPRPAAALPWPTDLFSAEPLVYGDSQARFAVLALSMACVAALCALAAARARDPAARWRPLMIAATLLAGVATWVACMTLLSRTLGDSSTTVRYAIPVLIGGFASAWVLAHELLPDLPGWRAKRWLGPALVGLAVACMAPFAAGARERATRAIAEGSILAFKPPGTWYQSYVGYVLGGEARRRVERAQALVPKGEPILAWVATPFLLDYGRNPIVDLELGGLTNPWASIPPHRYVLWEYRGTAVRDAVYCRLMALGVNSVDAAAGTRCAELWQQLARQLPTGDRLYDDGELLLYRIQPP